ncbi:hypothetical protein, partial [Enterobacter asburiae]
LYVHLSSWSGVVWFFCVGYHQDVTVILVLEVAHRKDEVLLTFVVFFVYFFYKKNRSRTIT